MSDAPIITPVKAAPTVVLTVAYDGLPFAGFASQPGFPTVQSSLEAALRTTLRCEIETQCAGRTDAGVHALGQVVSFPATGSESGSEEWLRSLNALTPDGIAVREIRYAQPRFSARHDAISREYRYRLVTGPVPPMFLAPVAWGLKRPLDIEAMRRGAEFLVGEHDFRSFCVSESAIGKRTVRRVHAIEITEEQHLGEDGLMVRVVGNAFLHSMVRTIVGTLVEVGRGKKHPDWVREVLEKRDRAQAGPKAPACGLTLWKVEYRPEVWL